MSNNPCTSCCGTLRSPKSNCKKGSCLCFCDPYISPKSDLAVACGESGSLDLTTLDSDTTVCGEDEVKYQFLYAEKGFFDLAFVTQEGILTWIPSPCAKKSTGGVVFKVVCGCLSKIVTATIGRKSKCCGTVCAEGEVCDECVGCVSLTGDLAVNII